jgi:hypothetical protein
MKTYTVVGKTNVGGKPIVYKEVLPQYSPYLHETLVASAKRKIRARHVAEHPHAKGRIKYGSEVVMR